MKINIEYRIATNADFQGIIDLYIRMYNTDRTMDDLNWLYNENPMGKGVLFIALDGGKVVGIQGIVSYQFQKQTSKLLTYKSEDSLIDARYRGQGIFRKLYSLVHEYVDKTLLWGFTDKKIIFEKIGLPSQYQFETALSVNGIVSPNIFVNRRYRHIKSIALTILGIYQKLKPRASKGKDSSTLIKVDNLTPEALILFVKKLSIQNPNIYYPIFDLAYIKWRLIDNPKIEDYYIGISKNEQNEIVHLSFVAQKNNSCFWLSTYSLDNSTVSKHIRKVRTQIHKRGIKVIYQYLIESNDMNKQNKTLMKSNGFISISKGLWAVNNSEVSEHNFSDFLCSSQLMLY